MNITHLLIVISAALNISRSTWAVTFGGVSSSSRARLGGGADSRIKEVFTRNLANFRKGISVVVGERATLVIGSARAKSRGGVTSGIGASLGACAEANSFDIW